MSDEVRDDYRQVADALEVAQDDKLAMDILQVFEGIPVGERALEIYRAASDYNSGE